ncbi:MULTISPECIES: hypothetical protein [unclassified Bacteroides]|uniref:hypothetical protein n=1 Tax=unclassified Bacteroides TaxID=2646097 RepID=UPI0004E0D7B0|nr:MULTISPECIES: hypothetical protein [unclassified Bacteroides]
MKKLSLLLLLFLSFVSCKKEEEERNIWYEETSFVFHSRECKYMWAFNVSKTEKPYYGITTIERKYIGSKQSVSVQNYTLEFTTCNVGMDAIVYDNFNYKEAYDSGDEEILFRIPVYRALWHRDNPMQDAPDKIIEAKLSAYFNKQKTTRMWIECVDYRTTPIKDIKITASADINDVKAGESLNKQFLVDGYPMYHDFIITSNKDLITDPKKISDITIDRYLYNRPMAPADMRFRFVDDFDIKAPVETAFTVEITTLDGHVLKSETPLVILTPRAK